jgi:hypothetical protein
MSIAVFEDVGEIVKVKKLVPIEIQRLHRRKYIENNREKYNKYQGIKQREYYTDEKQEKNRLKYQKKKEELRRQQLETLGNPIET